jgi:hypothetical protein
VALVVMGFVSAPSLALVVMEFVSAPSVALVVMDSFLRLLWPWS